MASQPITSSGSFASPDTPRRDLLDECVHCGFCLPSCPTFVLYGEEMDSPRGRIYLMRAALDGAPINEEMVTHFDRCLGCMSCETACPSGVHYGELIEATRAQVERSYRRPLSTRLQRWIVFSLFPYPKRLAVARRFLRLYQQSGLERLVRTTRLLSIAPKFLQTMESIAPRIGPRESIAEFLPSLTETRGTVALLAGCVQGSFFPQVNEATVRVLRSEGFDVVVPAIQGCCGALSAHVGRLDEAREFARRLIDAFEAHEVEAVIVNSAGCGSTMKEYGEMLSGDRDYADRARAFGDRTRDIAEFLAGIEPIAPRHPLEITVAYHDACHLGHAQRVKQQPRQLLSAITGITVREIAEGEICCGSAGVYNIFEGLAAAQLGDRKAGNVAATGAQLLIAANPGCTMQIASALERLGTPMPTLHTIELLDASIQGESSDDLLARLNRRDGSRTRG